MDNLDPENIIVAVTGHRPEKLGGYGEKAYERLFVTAFTALRVLHPKKLITGMALGWDTATAEAALMLGIPYDAYIPFVGQESKWPRDSQKFYQRLLGSAARVVECSEPGYSAAKMHVRNHAMVDDIVGKGPLLAMWDEDPEGGTAACIRYAKIKEVEIINVYPEWLKGARHG